MFVAIGGTVASQALRQCLEAANTHVLQTELGFKAVLQLPIEIFCANPAPPRGSLPVCGVQVSGVRVGVQQLEACRVKFQQSQARVGGREALGDQKFAAREFLGLALVERPAPAPVGDLAVCRYVRFIRFEYGCRSGLK